MADKHHAGGAPLPRAWHFPAPSVAELTKRLTAAGDGATLTVLPYESGGLLRLYLRVVDPASDATARAATPDINESHPCPPFTDCGGGG